MAEILAFVTNLGVPLTGGSVTARVRRTDTAALVVTDAALTELGDGLYRLSFASVATLEYAFVLDADPSATGQVSAQERYQWGGVSGVQDEAIEVTLPAIPAAVWEVDLTGMLSGFVTAGEQLNAVRQFSFNKLWAAPGSPGLIDLYLDGGATIRVSFEHRDFTGGGVVGVNGIPARREEAA